MNGLWRKKTKRAKTPKPAPKPAAGRRRLTGAAREMPRGLRLFLRTAVFLAVAAAALRGGWALLKLHFRMNPEFRLGNIGDNVVIKTGKMVTPKVVIESFGLKEGKSLFDVDIGKWRRNFLNTPNVRDIAIERKLPGNLYVEILERVPIARVKPLGGWVVDENGVVFIRAAGTGHLPLIQLSDRFKGVKPGARLDGMEMAAIRVIQSAMRPGFRLRIKELDARGRDYLLLKFSDLRRAKFAWRGMPGSGRESAERMRLQLDQLEQAMETAIGRTRKVWDATQPNRPVAKSAAWQ